MSFTTPCFIRKNTPVLRKELSGLGYRTHRAFTDANLLYCIYDEVLFYYDDKHPERHAYGRGIDCGTNEQLFLAIAALRDDNCKGQYITDGEVWELCTTNTASRHIVLSRTSFNWDTVHKATVQELINHFKTKEQ